MSVTEILQANLNLQAQAQEERTEQRASRDEQILAAINAFTQRQQLESILNFQGRLQDQQYTLATNRLNFENTASRRQDFIGLALQSESLSGQREALRFDAALQERLLKIQDRNLTGQLEQSRVTSLIDFVNESRRQDRRDFTIQNLLNPGSTAGAGLFNRQTSNTARNLLRKQLGDLDPNPNQTAGIIPSAESADIIEQVVNNTQNTIASTAIAGGQDALSRFQDLIDGAHASEGNEPITAQNLIRARNVDTTSNQQFLQGLIDRIGEPDAPVQAPTVDTSRAGTIQRQIDTVFNPGAITGANNEQPQESLTETFARLGLTN